ncbi:MAG TPA: hypothetical protein VH158_06135 [Gemmatimonadales bacterium]|nr:hypothetical protein [Gemmatimonadales bacterium]
MPRAHRRFLGSAVLAVAILAAPAARVGRAQRVQREWAHLGARQVDLRADHDVLRAAGEGRFKRLRLVVEGGDLEMFDVRITFGDGATYSPVTRFRFTGRARSHVIDLPGAARVIRWIDFYYSSIPGGRRDKATVHLYGR